MLLRHIHYFLAVAEHRGFTRAATALHVSQPALSQQIRQLEESLGAQLFDRSGRHIQLTDAGEAWLGYAKNALRSLEEGKRAIHDVEDLSRGSLRVYLVAYRAANGEVLCALSQYHPCVTGDVAGKDGRAAAQR